MVRIEAARLDGSVDLMNYQVIVISTGIKGRKPKVGRLTNQRAVPSHGANRDTFWKFFFVSLV